MNPYLTQHLAWWTAAYGTAPRHSVSALVSREWDDLVTRSRTPEHFVCVAEDTLPRRPVGVRGYCHGFMSQRKPGEKGSSLLMEAADSWMATQAVLGRKVFVTAGNAPALKLYERFSYRVVDVRGLGAALR